jgi:hypothetical protein
MNITKLRVWKPLVSPYCHIWAHPNGPFAKNSKSLSSQLSHSVCRMSPSQSSCFFVVLVNWAPLAMQCCHTIVEILLYLSKLVFKVIVSHALDVFLCKPWNDNQSRFKGFHNHNQSQSNLKPLNLFLPWSWELAFKLKWTSLTSQRKYYLFALCLLCGLKSQGFLPIHCHVRS